MEFKLAKQLKSPRHSDAPLGPCRPEHFFPFLVGAMRLNFLPIFSDGSSPEKKAEQGKQESKNRNKNQGAHLEAADDTHHEQEGPEKGSPVRFHHRVGVMKGDRLNTPLIFV